jgi:hypothetical protein
MKVLDLRCAHNHAFEGWFAGEDDFQDQLRRGLLQCPICADGQVRKVLSAPRINRGAVEVVAPTPATPENATSTDHRASGGGLPAPLKADLLQWVRQAMERSEDVGGRFVDEARSIHRGESPERPIRGKASVGEAMELLEEGIPVLALPPAANETLH